MQQLIENVSIFTQGALHDGTLVIGDDGLISEIRPASGPCHDMLLPGMIDAHVHFRDPGLTQKADIRTESHAAVAGGVTTVLDMPNVNPTTTTPEALAQKHALFEQKSLVDYGIWYGITTDNVDQAIRDYGRPDSPHRNEICGFKVFLGSSTGGMLMNDVELLRHLFSQTDRVIGIHSESEDIIARNRQKFLDYYAAINPYMRNSDVPDDLPLEFHPRIRSIDACVSTTRMAVNLALETGAHLHICHITTAEELDIVRQAMADPRSHITAEVTPAHLTFSQEDYRRLGSRIKCNPAIKRVQDRYALRAALTDGTLYSIGTDHAPHLLSDKQGGAIRAASGMPSIQFSLLAMLELVQQNVLPLSRMVELMSTNPARLFGYTDRGEIALGMRADLVRVSSAETTTVTRDTILSKCGWSPFEGHTFTHKVKQTWVGGQLRYSELEGVPFNQFF